ncbi:hypothetical protein [Ponticoccus alexandrii]|uniref:Uncharacterized protein n=1 Tax=Ponticoccus alexandrii TaxID=1943633 RepID=A0ABX7FA00_9RHOB|nr:hypothetical protein [Ponticoccus alexandrii]ETA50394.1 hypothetical protein P279_19650 [Rhodobacteraceae bacterium PD-2]QRF67368.1 hypothetical protein GQA70_14240 [Ponticoccus alexandrii]
MKTLILMTLALGLGATGALADPIAAEFKGGFPLPSKRVLHQVPDHILHPKPKLKIKIPTPGCLSCPGVPVDQGAVVLPAFR